MTQRFFIFRTGTAGFAIHECQAKKVDYVGCASGVEVRLINSYIKIVQLA